MHGLKKIKEACVLKLIEDYGPNPDKSGFTIDGLARNPKRGNFQISHLIISVGYEIEILEF